MRFNGFMKRLKLPPNRSARQSINIAVVVVWLVIAYLISIWIGKPFDRPPLSCFLYFIPIVLPTKYIWTGRIKPRARINSSMDD